MDRSTARHALKYLEEAEKVAIEQKISSTEALKRVTGMVKLPCRAIGLVFAALRESSGRLTVARGELEKKVNKMEDNK